MSSNANELHGTCNLTHLDPASITMDITFFFLEMFEVLYSLHIA